VRPAGEQPACYAKASARRLQLPKVYASVELLNMAHEQAEQPTGKFFPAGYIPLLKNHVKGQTGSAIANPFTGKIIAAKDSKATVTAQSTTKLYMAALLMILKGQKGEDELFATVGKEASMEPFNADSRIKDDIPHRPTSRLTHISTSAPLPRRTASGKCWPKRTNNWLRRVKRSRREAVPLKMYLLSY